MGRQSEVMDTSCDITQTSYDARGLVTSVSVGTSDGTLLAGQGFPARRRTWSR